MSFPEIELKSVQLVLFFKELRKGFNKIKVASALCDSVNIFNGEPTILPFPDDAPAEVPRIILQGDNNNCQISLQRLTLTLTLESSTISNSLNGNVNDFKSIYKICIEELGFVVSRIALVLNGELKVLSPSAFVNENYVKESIIDLQGFELGFYFKPEIGGSKFNKWLRLLSSDGNVLSFLLDFNTVETDSEMSIADIERVYTELINTISTGKVSLFGLEES